MRVGVWTYDGSLRARARQRKAIFIVSLLVYFWLYALCGGGGGVMRVMREMCGCVRECVMVRVNIDVAPC